MALTPEAKKLLAETIRGTSQNPERGIRVRLLRAIHDEADRQYRLSIPLEKARLDEAHRRRRERIEAWIAERVRATRPKNATESKAAEARFLAQAEKEAAATFLNRLVLLRQLEALGLSKPVVLTGGWKSKGYRELRDFAPGLCAQDLTEGYATLLQFVFDELSIDLPGLFGDVGLSRLFPIPASMLREVVERLDERGLASAWTDDTSLGWVYQYWNDPDREALDAKINGGGKIEPHEIASKTQMFTERYMVEWLLQNSLGLTWLCICKKHGWTADAESVLPMLEARRVEWRAKREAGEVALDALMPIEGELEDHWKYFVPQPIPDDAVEQTPESVRALRILDPACGSGHFLVIAFGLLEALYREEARHRGKTITDREIAESILENNLFGIDIDSRAIQIAAAALYLKARSLAKDARPKTLNLVAPMLQLGNLPHDDPAVVHLRQDLKREVGIPEELTNKLLTALAGVDYLGSLLKVDAAVEATLRSLETEFEHSQRQGNLFRGFPAQQVKLPVGDAKATVLDKLEEFLAKHSKSADLGLRLDGEQLAAGVRFVRLVKEKTYDLVVGNPPYQGLSRTGSFEYVAKSYPRGKDNLYAAFLERSLDLAKPGGLSGLLTMRGWMFLGQFSLLREWLLGQADLRLVGDVDRGAFEDVPDEVLATAMSVIRRTSPSDIVSVALQPTPTSDRARDNQRTARKRAAVLAQVGRVEFRPREFESIKGEPIVYWWTKEFLDRYAKATKLGAHSPARFGVNTGNNGRYVRFWWECATASVSVSRGFQGKPPLLNWVPFILGGKGRMWFEDLRNVISWHSAALAMKVDIERKFGPGGVHWKVCNSEWYFRQGIAFSMIGTNFSARVHRYSSVIGNMGSSVFPQDIPATVCIMNSSLARFQLESLNPGVHFEVGDVNRLAMFPVQAANEIFAQLDAAFTIHEAARESSIEFARPGASPWCYAQQWAQCAVDRTEGTSIPRYQPYFDTPEPKTHVSFAMGIALGRLDANDKGVLSSAPPDALPSGTLFLNEEGGDSLDHPACWGIHATWKEHRLSISEGDDLRTYLRRAFFDYHRGIYENRPIYFPLSSSKKSFVAFISIHRWQDNTLNDFLADHLVPAKRRLEGELDDLRTARASGANKGKVERRYDKVQKLLEELNDFIAKVTEITEKGPPPPDEKTPKRDVDARYVMDPDDGVMVNSAALWPLLEPQWKDPKKWWRELATAQGKKDYDWSHLAARYFPKRVREKCHKDPSLAVAHKCFWELHPAKAYSWELRLQDEIRPDFTIDEPASDAARAKFLAEHPTEAAEILAAELRRRERKAAKVEEEESGPGELFESDDEPEEEAEG